METPEVMPMSCWEYAEQQLSQRAIKDSTRRSYLDTLRSLNLVDVPVEWATVAMVNNRLQRVFNPGTRRKHIINIRACLGLKIPVPRGTQKDYTLPDTQQLHDVLENSQYKMYGFSMLYAGLRVAESCIKQMQEGNVIFVDRQRRADCVITTSKTAGPVVVPPWFGQLYEMWTPTLAPNTVYVGMKRLFKRELGTKLTPHGVRHMFANNLVRAGASPEVLRRQMRHHDVTVALRYYVQTTDNDVAAAVANLASGPGAR
jgi:integrase/recombinase XerD